MGGTFPASELTEIRRWAGGSTPQHRPPTADPLTHPPTHLPAQVPQLDDHAALCDLSHVEADRGDHVLGKLPRRQHVDQARLARVLQPDQRQLHLLAEEEAACESGDGGAGREGKGAGGEGGGGAAAGGVAAAVTEQQWRPWRTHKRCTAVP